MKLKSFSPNNLIGIAVGLLAGIAVILTAWFFSDNPHYPPNRFPEQSRLASSVSTNAASVPATTNEGGTLNQVGEVGGQNYDAYLDSLCPRLSPAQEDKILAEYGRDSRILVGLALAGSSRARAKAWLEEALQKTPNDPLVLFAILSRADEGFDRLKLARNLASIMPNDAEPLYAAASESIKAGDREAALKFLREAAQRDNFSSLYQSAVDSKLNVYRLAGSPEQGLLARVYLNDNTFLGDGAIVDLNNDMSPFDNSYKIGAGNEEVATLLLDAMQKALNSPGRGLGNYFAARELESSYLRAFLRSDVEGENPSSFLKVPASQLLADATAEKKDFYPIGWFSHDKPGVFRQLAPEEQKEFLDRIQRDGELPAFQWANQIRPDIFRSPDFVPKGFTKKYWIENFQMTKR